MARTQSQLRLAVKIGLRFGEQFGEDPATLYRVLSEANQHRNAGARQTDTRAPRASKRIPRAETPELIRLLLSWLLAA